MSWREEAEQGLPSPRRNEPGHLRQDILDELTDHLAFAAEREQERGAKTDAEIRQRVLEQFGNPMTIARKLWFDAMKETIMRDWIQTIVIGIMCVAVVGFMTLVYKQMQTTSNAMLSALNDRPTLAEDLYPSIEVHLHRGSVDGPPVDGVQIRFRGKMFNEESQSFNEVTESDGIFEFGPIRPGSYSLEFTDASTDMSMYHTTVLFSGEGTKVIHIPVPSEKDNVLLDMDIPLPKYIDNSYQRVLLTMTEKWTLHNYTWLRQSEVMTGAGGLYEASGVAYSSAGKINPREINVDGFGPSASSALYRPNRLIDLVTAHELLFSNPRGIFSVGEKENKSNVFNLIRIQRKNSHNAIKVGWADLNTLVNGYQDWSVTTSIGGVTLKLPEPFLEAYTAFSLCHWNQQNSDVEISDDRLYRLSKQNPGLVLKDTYEIPWSSRIFNISNNDQWAFFPQENGYSIDEKGGAFFHLPDAFVEVSEPSMMKLYLALNFRQIRDENNTLNAYWAYDFDEKIEKRISREPLELSEQPFWELDMKDVRKKPSGQHPTAMYLQTFHVNIPSASKSPDEEQTPSGFVIKWESAKNNEADVVHGHFPNVGYTTPFIAVMYPIEDAMAERDRELADSGV
jgi:hypothetical protein